MNHSTVLIFNCVLDFKRFYLMHYMSLELVLEITCKGIIILKTLRKIMRLSYKFARITNDVTTLLSGDLKKILRRIKNKILGRQVGKRIFK